MTNAFNYMFKDNKYGQKALVYGAIMFLSQLASNVAKLFFNEANNQAGIESCILLNIISGLLQMLTIGYGFVCIKALIEQKENFLLPFFKFKQTFILGLKNSVAVFLYTLTIFAFLILSELIFSYALNSIILHYVMVLLTICYVIVYTLSFAWIFTNTEAITSYFRIRKATQLIKANAKTYLKSLVLFAIAAMMCAAPCFVITCCLHFIMNKIVVAILMSLTTALVSAYVSFACFFITAKAIKPETAENL